MEPTIALSAAPVKIVTFRYQPELGRALESPGEQTQWFYKLGGVRRSQEEPGGAERSHEVLGGARRKLFREAIQGSYSGKLSATGCVRKPIL